MVRAGVEEDHRLVYGVDALLHGNLFVGGGGKGAKYTENNDLIQDGQPLRIESKNSEFDLVAFSLSIRNSAASSSSIGNSSFLSTQTFCRMGASISSSSRRVPERLTLIAG